MLWRIVRYRLSRELRDERDVWARCAARACADRAGDRLLRSACLTLMLYYYNVYTGLPGRRGPVRSAIIGMFGFDPDEVIAVCR